MGGSIGHGLSGTNRERENSLRSGNILIVDLNNCLRVQLTFWEFRFWTLLPCILVIFLWGCRGRVTLLVCHPPSPCHVCWHLHACLVKWGWSRWGQGRVRWIDIQYCKEPCSCSSWCLRKGLSHRKGNLIMMEHQPWIREWRHGQMDKDRNRVSDSWPLIFLQAWFAFTTSELTKYLSSARVACWNFTLHHYSFPEHLGCDTKVLLDSLVVWPVFTV